mmetsp:Transcript_5769/g.16952  ORF Transcript_5769/g.16952 Transcript_5769/m.16952 type:complete len:211 (+) Transcript_5769:1000-1632(+)
MTFIIHFCTLFIICATCMHILVEGSQEVQLFSAFLKQRIYDSLRSRTDCLTGVDKRALHSVHPSGIVEAQRYLEKMGKDGAYYEPDPSMVNSYVTYMCETKHFGSGTKLPVLPQEYAMQESYPSSKESYPSNSPSIEGVKYQGISSDSSTNDLFSGQYISHNSDFPVFPTAIFFCGALFGALGLQCFMKYYVIIPSSSVGNQAKLRRPEL